MCTRRSDHKQCAAHTWLKYCAIRLMAEGLDCEAWTSSSTSQKKSIPKTPPKLWPGVPFDSPRSSAVSPVHNPADHEAEDSNADSFLIVQDTKLFYVSTLQQ